MFKSRGCWTAVVVASGMFGAPTVAELPSYSLMLIDLFEGDFANTATAINNAGQVAGWSNAPGGHHAWRWTAGVLDDIGEFGGVFMQSQSINEQGHVAGYGNDDQGDWIGWMWDGQALDTIPTFGGPGSRAWGINDMDQVVGDAQMPDSVWRALLWEGGEPSDLGTLGGGNSLAYDINNPGSISGFATNADINARAVIWQMGHIVELEHPAEHADSVAYGLNDAGVAVGNVGELPFVLLPATWVDGSIQILPQLPGDEPLSYPWKVNASNQIVGWSQLAFNNNVASTWIDGEVYDLNMLVDTAIDITLVQAWDINECGLIVGMGLTDTGPRAYVLTPQIAEDLDDDGVVGVTDMLALLAAWGSCPGCPADINDDGQVNVVDLLALLSAWGGGCG